MFCIRRATVMLENICSNIEILLKDPTNYDDHVCFESVLKQCFVLTSLTFIESNEFSFVTFVIILGQFVCSIHNIIPSQNKNQVFIYTGKGLQCTNYPSCWSVFNMCNIHQYMVAMYVLFSVALVKCSNTLSICYCVKVV